MTETVAASYRQVFEGWLSGLLAWSDLDTALASVAASPEGWWIYDTRADVPAEPVPAAQVKARLDEIVAFLKSRHRADYCGFVYADDKAVPSMVKVYDPRNASSCGFGTSLPVFTISRQKPEALPFADEPEPARTGLVERIFGSRS